MDIEKLTVKTMNDKTKEFYVVDRNPKGRMGHYSFYILYKKKMINFTETMIDLVGYRESKVYQIWTMSYGGTPFEALYYLFNRLKSKNKIRGEYQFKNLQAMQM